MIEVELVVGVSGMVWLGGLGGCWLWFAELKRPTGAVGLLKDLIGFAQRWAIGGGVGFSRV